MVQVTLRVRPKNGYTYTSKIKTVIMDSSTRLEELLQRHGDGSAASSHAALYLYGRELPLNSSIASHNLEDGVILESCKSPNMSAAISAVLRDLERIKKSLHEGERRKDNLRDLLEVPDEYLRDNSYDATFWQTEKWSDDSLKNRMICLATIKKMLQRDDRYAIHDLPHCTDCNSLHQSIQEIIPAKIGFLFSPATRRDGKPSTIWVLLQQKLFRQIEVAANFQLGHGTTSLDSLEEFIRLDALRYPTNINTSVASPSPARRRRRNQPQATSRENAGGNATPASANVNGALSGTPRRKQGYCPAYASGPFAVLCTLLEAMEGIHFHSNGRRQLSLTEDTLKHLAQKRCRSNFYDRQMMRGSRSAFACMEGLTEKNLVRKEINMDGTERWQLLPDGEKLARECLNFERAVKFTIPSRIFFSSQGGNEGDTIALIVDKREDAHFRKRLQVICGDERVPTEERELPAGDYLFLQGESVLPLIIERKTWSDLADSVHSRGRAHRRLDCVKIGATSLRCSSGRCQLCRMLRCGCQQILFIIEGARCRGKDTRRARDARCSEQKRCQACKALLERHGVTQSELETVLHKLQAVHGCYITYTRSYNETISSLFTIREILKSGGYFASQIVPAPESNSNHDEDLARAIALSLGDDTTSTRNVFSYNEFCTNARRTCESTQSSLKRKNGDILRWQSELLVGIVANRNMHWKESIEGQIFNGLVVPEKRKITDEKNNVNPKRQRILHPEVEICIDDYCNNDGSIIELDQPQDTHDLLSHQSEGSDEDVMVLEESQHSIQILEESQNSIQITSINHGSKYTNLKSDDEIVALDDAQTSNRGHSISKAKAPASTEVVSYCTAVESNVLLVVQGWEEYEEKFNTDLNHAWQQCYDKQCASPLFDSLPKYREEMEKLVENGNTMQYLYLHRTDFIATLLWMQVKHGINVRIVPSRACFTNELQRLWTSTSYNIDPSSPFAPSQNTNNAKAFISLGDRAASDTLPNQIQPSKPLPSSSQKASSNARKMPPPLSPAAALAIEARLRRFGGSTSDLSSTHQGIPEIRKRTKIITNVDRGPPYNNWSCAICTLENDGHKTICEVCGERRMPSQRALDSSGALSAGLQKTPLLPQNLHSGPYPALDFSDIIHTVAPSLPNTKRPITCGACALPGHNRGNATASNCPAYFDEKEIDLRKKKRSKALEKASLQQQEYEESKREIERQEQREADFNKQMSQLKETMEAATRLQRKDSEAKRKKADSARRRANKFR